MATLAARIAGRLAAWVIATVVGLALVEAGLRLTGMYSLYLTDPLFRASDLPGVSYEFRPNATGWAWGHTPTQTNAQGMRGPEVATTKPPGAFRIGIFGDSVTFGQGVTERDTFARVLERTLRDRFPGRTIEVLNFGVPAYNITNMVSTFCEKGTRLGLDVAILAPIVEDYGFHRDHKADVYGYPVHAATPISPGLVKNTLRNLQLAYAVRDAWFRIRGSGEAEQEVLHDPNGDGDLAARTWARAEAEIARFTDTARAAGIVPIYASLGWATAPQVDESVRRHGLLHVEMHAVVSGYPPEQLQVSSRDNHPSVLHHGLIAAELAKVVVPIVAAGGTGA